jgi:uncharacterized protein (DUF305 family)
MITTPLTTEKSRFPSRNLVVGLLVVWLLGLGLQFYFLSQHVTTPKEGSQEVSFTRDMMAHHAQAVEMATRIRDRSSDEALRTLALDMVLTQQNQIGQMHAWLELWNVSQEGLAAPMQGLGEMMGMAPQASVNALTTLPSAEAEISFLQLMIRHHEGGVMMAQTVLDTSQPVVKRLAESVIAGQTGEIKYMEELLAERGAERLEPLAPMVMTNESSSEGTTQEGMNH